MTRPTSAPPIVPVTPWNEEAVPAIGAILVIASVPKFDVVNEKLTKVSCIRRMNSHSGSSMDSATIA
ncbi:hypothetical protein D3C83_114550 [compost metagenome]